jgi:hypothetical protein
VVSLCVNSSGQVLAGPETVIEGLPDVEDDDESLPELIVRRAGNRNAQVDSAQAPQRPRGGQHGAAAGGPQRGFVLLGPQTQRNGLRTPRLRLAMQVGTFIAIFFVTWWICLFLVLPFKVRNQVDAAIGSRGPSAVRRRGSCGCGRNAGDHECLPRWSPGCCCGGCCPMADRVLAEAGSEIVAGTDPGEAG